jgi:membrane protein required for colicin V production
MPLHVTLEGSDIGGKSLIATVAAAASTTTYWLDPVVVGIIIASAFLGLWRGLIRSVASFAGLILGAIFAGKLAAYIDPTLKQANIQHPAINGTWAFVIAFLVILVAVEIAANLVARIIRIMFLGWADRMGGAAFGLARGVLLAMILLAGLAQFNSKQFNAQVKQASTAIWLWENVPTVASMLPAGIRDSTIRLVHDQAPFLKEPYSPKKLSS